MKQNIALVALLALGSREIRSMLAPLKPLARSLTPACASGIAVQRSYATEKSTDKICLHTTPEASSLIVQVLRFNEDKCTWEATTKDNVSNNLTPPFDVSALAARTWQLSMHHPPKKLIHHASTNMVTLMYPSYSSDLMLMFYGRQVHSHYLYKIWPVQKMTSMDKAGQDIALLTDENVVDKLGKK